MNKEFEEYIDSIKKAVARESATPKDKKPSPSEILIAAREMMRRVKDDRSNKTNR
jgi:hypothetical protein